MDSNPLAASHTCVMCCQAQLTHLLQLSLGPGDTPRKHSKYQDYGFKSISSFSHMCDVLPGSTHTCAMCCQAQLTHALQQTHR